MRELRDDFLYCIPDRYYFLEYLAGIAVEYARWVLIVPIGNINLETYRCRTLAEKSVNSSG